MGGQEGGPGPKAPWLQRVRAAARGVSRALHVSATLSRLIVKPARQAATALDSQKGLTTHHTRDKAEVSLEPVLQTSGDKGAALGSKQGVSKDHARLAPPKKARQLDALVSVTVTTSGSCDVEEQASVVLEVRGILPMAGDLSRLGPSPWHLHPNPHFT